MEGNNYQLKIVQRLIDVLGLAESGPMNLSCVCVLILLDRQDATLTFGFYLSLPHELAMRQNMQCDLDDAIFMGVSAMALFVSLGEREDLAHPLRSLRHEVSSLANEHFRLHLRAA